MNFTPSASASTIVPKFIYLLNADSFPPTSIPSSAFVVYQGHHGDTGASFADVVLPGSAYTEKSVTYVNTEGRTQLSRAAVGAPGSAREDWKIIRALSEVLGASLPYEEVSTLRDRMWEICPSLVKYDNLEGSSFGSVAIKALTKSGGAAGREGGKEGAFKKVIEDFYRTDVVSRNSITMGKCTVRLPPRYSLCAEQY